MQIFNLAKVKLSNVSRLAKVSKEAHFQISIRLQITASALETAKKLGDIFSNNQKRYF